MCRPKTTSDQRLLSGDGDTSWLHDDPWRVMRIQSEFVEGFGALAEIGPAVSVFGSARIARPGSNLTVVATGLMLGRALDAAERLAPQGIDLEVIHPRTLVPLDIDTIVASVEKNHRLMVVHEASRTAGFGAEIAAQVQERAFFALDAPVWRVCGSDTPLPQDPTLEQAAIPSVDEIVTAALALAAV